MTPRYGLYGERSRDFLTYGGRILWHSNAAELAYLVPTGATPMAIPSDIPDDSMLHIGKHPDMASVRFPIRREDFRAA